MSNPETKPRSQASPGRFPWLVAVVLSAVLPGAAVRAMAEERYVVVDLGSLGDESIGYGISERGEVTGATTTPSGERHVFVWNAGTMTDLWIDDPIEGLDTSDGRLVNDAGQIAGRAEDASGMRRAFLFDPKTGATDLGTFGGDVSKAGNNGLNEIGQVVGFASFDNGQNNAFLWLPEPDHGFPAGLNNIGTLGGIDSKAMAINELGQVAGRSQTASGERHPFLWLPEPALGLPAGMNDLGTIGPEWGGGCEDLNDSGEVIGAMRNESTGVWTAMAWDSVQGVRDLGALPGFLSSAGRGINSAGFAVGYSNTRPVPDDPSGDAHAWILEGGSLVDLNDRIDLDSGWVLRFAWDINDRGQITGQGLRDGEPRAFLLVPASALAGTVNSGAGEIAATLLVNGTAGGPLRTVVVSAGDPVSIDFLSAPAGPAEGRYVFWVWRALPNHLVDLRSAGQTIGVLANPTPLQPSREPQPFLCMRPPGIPGSVCTGLNELAPAQRTPWNRTRASGLPNPSAFLVQGVLEDDGAATPVGFSVTNAVILIVE